MCCGAIRLCILQETARAQQPSSAEVELLGFVAGSYPSTLQILAQGQGRYYFLRIRLRSQISQKYQDSSLGDSGNPPYLRMKSITDTH